MWLVLCSANDEAALWAYRGLVGRDLSPIELVCSEALAYALHWEHRLGKGGVSTRIRLHDGRVINSEDVRGTLNRILSLPSEHLQLASPEDRTYAMQELYALFVSWLHGLPGPILNRPAPFGLAGRWRPLSEWLWLALKAGLEVHDYQPQDLLRGSQPAPGFDSERGAHTPMMEAESLLVVKGQVLGPEAPDEVIQGCRMLGEISQTDLLGIDLVKGTRGEWRFLGASHFPDLRIYGEDLLHTLQSAIQGDDRERK